MNKRCAWLAVFVAAAVVARAQDAVSPSAPADATGTVAEAAAPLPAPEWVGFVRVLRDDQGEVRAIRLVADGKLIAVELNEKGKELAKTPKTRKLLVKGEQVTRDNRPWLVVSGFQEAPDTSVAAPVPPEPPVPADIPAPPVPADPPAPVEAPEP